MSTEDPAPSPALKLAQTIGTQAAELGFDWDSIEGPIAKLDEEVAELKAAIASGDRSAAAEELADTLFSLVNIARFLEVSAEDALHQGVQKFSRRFQHVKTKIEGTGRPMHEVSLEEMDRYWNEAKSFEAEDQRRS